MCKVVQEVLELCGRLICVTIHLWCSCMSSKPQVVAIQLGPHQGRCPPSVVGCWSYVMGCSLLVVSGRLVHFRLLAVGHL
jgi:hypothetical protein